LQPLDQVLGLLQQSLVVVPQRFGAGFAHGRAFLL
jgi:hypothetical protein